MPFCHLTKSAEGIRPYLNMNYGLICELIRSYAGTMAQNCDGNCQYCHFLCAWSSSSALDYTVHCWQISV